MSTIDNNVRPIVTSEMIEAAMRRGRQERSRAFWAMLQSIFGRRDEDAAGERQAPANTPPIAAAGRC